MKPGAEDMHGGKELARVVRGLCLRCQGQSWRLVLDCVETACPLHAVRTREVDAGLSAAVRAFCLACAGSEEDVATCSAHVPFRGQRPCPAYAHRLERVGGGVQRIRLLPGLSVPDGGAGSNRRESVGQSVDGESRPASNPHSV